jgi:hypothetical protein
MILCSQLCAGHHDEKNPDGEEHTNRGCLLRVELADFALLPGENRRHFRIIKVIQRSLH